MPKIQSEELEHVMHDMAGRRTRRRAAPPSPEPQPDRPPRVVSERPDPKLIREDPAPQPVSERPDPRPIGQGRAAAKPQKPMAPAIPREPDPQAVELVRLFYRLGPRDRKELLLIARLKAELEPRP